MEAGLDGEVIIRNAPGSKGDFEMQRSNRRIVFAAPDTVEVQQEEVNTDGLGPDELLVESLYSVVSAGTELACLSGGEEWFSFPRVPGYATVGRIVVADGSVTGLREGEVVLHYGGHQAYNRRKQGDFLLPVPGGIDGKVAAMTRLATVAFTSIRVSEIEAGDFVAVAGLGPVGNLAAQLAQIQGGRGDRCRRECRAHRPGQEVRHRADRGRLPGGCGGTHQGDDRRRGRRNRDRRHRGTRARLPAKWIGWPSGVS